MKNIAKKKLAIFDIDGTIFRSSLLIQLIEGLVSAGIFPRQAQKEVARDYLAWLNRRGSYENYLKQVIDIHLKYLAGAWEKDVLKVTREVVAFQKDRVYRYTRRLIGILKKQNFFLLAISGSPVYIVEKFAGQLGFDAFYGTIYEVSAGRFTGKRLNADSFADKKTVIKNFIAEKKLDVDLKKSVAVGDTESDISMLSLVGQPIAFNPNRVLADHARKRGWKIVVERKDMIYSLEDFKMLEGD
ncbi:MAG: HAD family phosphatase [Patescibacteria group bacterium]